MALVTKPFTFIAGETIFSSRVNSNFDAIINEINGALNAANLANGAVEQNKIADGAVSELKLAADAVSTAKIQALAVTAAKIANGTITNAQVAAAAAIALSKLAALTASKALVTDASGVITTSAVTAAELGYLAGVTSAIQTQLDGKLATTGKAADAELLDGNDSAAFLRANANSSLGTGITLNLSAGTVILPTA